MKRGTPYLGRQGTEKTEPGADVTRAHAQAYICIPDLDRVEPRTRSRSFAALMYSRSPRAQGTPVPLRSTKQVRGASPSYLPTSLPRFRVGALTRPSGNGQVSYITIPPVQE